MKLIIAIVRDSDSDAVVQALTGAQLKVTRIASTGGLLKRGVATMLIGVEDTQVEPAISLLKDNTTADSEGDKRATVFVVDVARFVQV